MKIIFPVTQQIAMRTFEPSLALKVSLILS